MKRNQKRKMQIAAEQKAIGQPPTLKNLNEHGRGIVWADSPVVFGVGRGVFSPRRFTKPLAKKIPPQGWLRR
jgi:hypothetical protein